MKQLIVLLLIWVAFSGNSQVETDSIVQSDTTLIPVYSHSMYDLRMSFGVYPEIQFINSPVISISASYARLLDVEWSAFGRGINVGFEFSPLEKYYGPKLTLWGAVFALIVGGNASVSAMCYFQEGRQGLYLRPEIGIGIPRIHLKYGFGFRAVGDEVIGVQRHSLTLGCHFTLFEQDPKLRTKN